MKTYNHEIHKRTFTGDNDNPITSDFSKSKKWAISYNIENYDHVKYEVFETKKECENRIEKLIKNNAWQYNQMWYYSRERR